jgi:4-hydroxy-3-polyprenylbenzoate decarboxylase
MSEQSIPANDQRPSAGWRDLRGWLGLVEQHGLLHTIDQEVDPDQELSAITLLGASRRNSGAFLFRRMKDDASSSRILTNMLGASEERYALTVGLDPALTTGEKITATRKILQRRVAPIRVARERAPVCEILLRDDDIDLTRFPVPKFWPRDGGRYIGTGNVTLTRHPATGLINAGVYRQMLHGPRRVGLSFVPGRHGLRNCQAWWARGEPCEVVVAYGIDPALFIAATQAYGPGESELDAAGGLMGAPVELTDAVCVGLPIPARAELVIEGLVYADRTEIEGPLGEFHGFYSGAPAPRPVIEVKAVHHRESPIFTAALMANYPSGEIGAYHAIMRSARICDSLESMGVPGVVGAYAHPGSASGYGFVVVSIKQSYPGHAAQVLALTAQCPAAAYCTKWIVVVDDHVDPTDMDQVLWAMTTMANPSDDIEILRNTWTFRSDPSLAPEQRPYGSKALINACRPHKQLSQPPKRALLSKGIYDRVTARWSELGLPGRPPALTHFEQD